MEAEREGRLNLMSAMGLEMRLDNWRYDRKESEGHLLHSQAIMASRFPGNEYLWVWVLTFLPFLKGIFLHPKPKWNGRKEEMSDFTQATKYEFNLLSLS